jgi:glycerophosphoryl diester phosphodiesterase
MSGFENRQMVGSARGVCPASCKAAPPAMANALLVRSTRVGLGSPKAQKGHGSHRFARVPQKAILNRVERAILVHGHRGARAVLPENTLPAFEYAIGCGADAIELDVAVTRDDVVVVSHDPTLNRAICRAPEGPRVIRECTLEEVRRWDCGTLRNPRFRRQKPVPGARVPTLDEVLALSERGAFVFNIEIKCFPERPGWSPAPQRFAELVCAAIQGHKLENRAMVQSFDFRILHAMRKLAPAIRLGALYVGRPKSFTAIAHQAGAEIVAPYHALVTPRKVLVAHAAGLQVLAWTANRPRDWKRLITAQVDGIITDNPESLLQHLRDQHLR